MDRVCTTCCHAADIVNFILTVLIVMAQYIHTAGTGKTTMANVVAKVLVKMKLLSTDTVIFVNNPLELLAGYVGQTPGKVDAKVAEAYGGIIFIDEAYSLLKEASALGGASGGNTASFAKEAIDTIMKHLDPPSCVFIFAGYEKQMNEFVKVNEGLARRIPYRYTFCTYSINELIQIFTVMCGSKGEQLSCGAVAMLSELLSSIPLQQRESQNAGIVSNLVAFAQLERDDRVDIHDAMENPDLASTLEADDLIRAVEKVKQMAVT